MKQLTKVISTFLLLEFISVFTLWAGTTGKIAGNVTDKKTGEPLPGTSIIVSGTMLGAASDINGNYTILNVPPGTYELQISFVGYQKATISDVRVFIDQTTRID